MNKTKHNIGTQYVPFSLLRPPTYKTHSKFGVFFKVQTTMCNMPGTMII